jgi:GNAT superfamily N-acetyltransferase
MPTIHLGMTVEQFRQLPRNPAFRYDYLDGTAILSPRTHHFHAAINLMTLKPQPEELSREISLRRLVDEDFGTLERLFSEAFCVVQPYGSLDEETRLRAAHDALERARGGGDGPWIRQASFAGIRAGQIVGALIVTLVPPGDPADWSSYRWSEPPPADAIARRLGRPHLTWVFVSPQLAGQGVGTTLLCAAAAELRGLGYEELLSTFVLGNHSSMLWHWRNGFRLLTYTSSPRRQR